MSIHGHVQRFSLGARVTLYEIDLTAFGLGVIRIAPTTDQGGEAINFGGQTYAPHPVKAEGFALSTGGSLPRPKMAVANLDNSFTALVEENDDLHGGILTRIRTYSRYLDSGEEPDGNTHLPLDIFMLSQKTEHTPQQIVWECAAQMDQEGVELPGRPVIRDYCDHVVRRWDPVAGAYDYSLATCPFAGGPHDENGDICEPADEVFSKRLVTCCMARFGANADLPTRAFPGVARIRGR
ncbi:MAG: phage minor tail protein L [Allosphingosinicella sp.]